MTEYITIVQSAGANPTLFSDWSLIIFTVFAQCTMAVSVFAGFALVLERKDLAINYWKFGLITLIIAFIASIGHLHSPLNALYTITQIGHSWLSREIVCTGALLACLLWLIFIPKKRKEVGAIGAIIALIYFYATMKVYTSVMPVPYWGETPTFYAFLGTSLVLGGSASLILSNNSDVRVLRLASLIILVIGAIFSAATPYLWLPVTAEGNFDILAFPLFAKNMYLFWALHVALLIIGLALLLSKKLILDSGCKYRAWLVFALLCISQLCGRTLFFLANIRIGV